MTVLLINVFFRLCMMAFFVIVSKRNFFMFCSKCSLFAETTDTPEEEFNFIREGTINRRVLKVSKYGGASRTNIKSF